MVLGVLGYVFGLTNLLPKKCKSAGEKQVSGALLIDVLFGWRDFGWRKSRKSAGENRLARFIRVMMLVNDLMMMMMKKNYGK